MVGYVKFGLKTNFDAVERQRMLVHLSVRRESSKAYVRVSTSKTERCHTTAVHILSLLNGQETRERDTKRAALSLRPICTASKSCHLYLTHYSTAMSSVKPPTAEKLNYPLLLLTPLIFMQLQFYGFSTSVFRPHVPYLCCN